MTNATKIPRELPESDVERQVIASDLSPPEFFRQEAEDCLNLSYQITDAKGQVSVLRLANLWMRLAENYHSSRRTVQPRPEYA
jgi:hypothetical protein